MTNYDEHAEIPKSVKQMLHINRGGLVYCAVCKEKDDKDVQVLSETVYLGRRPAKLWSCPQCFSKLVIKS